MRAKEVLLALVSTTVLLFTSCQARTPTLTRVLEAYPGLGTGIYEELGRWEEVLGAPSTVPQADEAETFFYWPEHGLGVFTHPLYEGQFRRRQRPERTVTSVIVPVRKSFHPEFLPVSEGVTVHFYQLLNLDRSVPSSRARSRQPRQHRPSHVDLVSSPLRKTVERLHLRDGEPVAVEIRDVWWLSHYD